MVVGKKRAILVACNYYHTQYLMHGCQNDVQTMHKLLKEYFYFEEEYITMMVETEAHDSPLEPTGKNIKHKLEHMIKHAEKGDILFFFFSGLGMLVNGSPVIVSYDMENITADYFRHQVNSLPEGVNFTFVCDSSHSGGLINGEKQQFGPDVPGQGSKPLPVQPNNGILFSACPAKETAARKVPNNNQLQTYGAFTNAIKMTVQHYKLPITNNELVARAAGYLQSETYKQDPCLYCIDDNVNEYFLGNPKDNNV